jgi:hypothetical protein
VTAVIDHQHRLVEHQPDQLARYYNDAFAWPTTIDSDNGDVRLQLGTVVDALVMRAGIAGEVNNVLVRHMFRAPIVVVPGKPSDWIFLTQTRTTMRQSVWEDLVRIQVGWKRRGDTILLPGMDTSDKGLRWLQRPREYGELPPWTAVVAAARRASSPGGKW